MDRITALAVVLALVAGCGGNRSDESSEPAPVDDFVTSARVATNRLRVALKSELGAAMQEGGPVAAVEVCNTRASLIAAEVSAAAGLEVGRVSTRHRNPANAADRREAAILAGFEARPAFEDTVITVEGRRTYLRAIRIDAPLCLQCHGPAERIDPALKKRLAALYPHDRATGYAAGNLRGAFVVR